jgi:hypothetical protein
LPNEQIDHIEALISGAQEKEPSLENIINARANLQTGKDRSTIVIIVFSIYAGIILLLSINLLYRGFYLQEKVFDNFTEVIKVAVVPIVTLVIGYYFGTEKSTKQRNDE